jgi:hypothetical protein
MELPLDSWWFPAAGVTGWACGAIESRLVAMAQRYRTVLQRLGGGRGGIESARPNQSVLYCDPCRLLFRIAWKTPGRIWGWFEGKGLSTSRVSPPAPLSISYGHVGCLKARAFPPPV